MALKSFTRCNANRDKSSKGAMISSKFKGLMPSSVKVLLNGSVFFTGPNLAYIVLHSCIQ